MKTIIYVFISGALGAIARFLMSFVIEGHYSVLAVNIIGSFFLAIVFNYLGKREILSEEACGALGTGFIGAFTTFSAFSMWNVNLLEAGLNYHAIIFTAVSLVFGLIAALLGIRVAEALPVPKSKRRGDKAA